MKSLIAFWKKDIINKLIVLVSLALVIGIAAVVVVASTMLGGKPLAVLADLLPAGATPTFDFSSYLTPNTVTPSPYTATPTPTIAIRMTETPTLLMDDQLSPTVDATSAVDSAATVAAAMGTSAISPVATSTVASQTTVAPTVAPQATATGSSSGATLFGCIPANKQKTGRVVEVVDANTVRILIDGPTYVVRYIGVGVPENAAFADAARLKNQELAYGKEVTLIEGLMQKDDRGRLLFYVVAGDKFINLELIKQGLGLALDAPPNNDCLSVFQAAQQEALSAGLGMWSLPTKTPAP